MAEIGERKLGLESITNRRLTWVNIKKPTREKLNILEESYLFHELNTEDCLSKIQMAKIDRLKITFLSYLFSLVLIRTRAYHVLPNLPYLQDLIIWLQYSKEN